MSHKPHPIPNWEEWLERWAQAETYREIGFEILIFDAVFMINQSIPLLYIVYDKVIKNIFKL